MWDFQAPFKGEETALLSFALFVAERTEKKNGAPEVFLDYDLTLIIEEICWRQQSRKVHEKWDPKSLVKQKSLHASPGYPHRFYVKGQ